MSLSTTDVDYVRSLVRERSGIALGEDKGYLVEARLAPLAEREGVASVAALIALVRSRPAALGDEVTEALATNETSFFRDLHPFDALRDEIIPAVVAARGGAGPAVWCAATSTGQEPYSLAMLLASSFAHLTGASVLATDLSEDVLRRAADGRYSQLEVNRGLPVSMLVRWFTQDGNEWQLSERIRRTVTFRQLNLVRPLPPLGPFDIVLLRNVLIYFERDLKAAVLREVARTMRPGGFLLLGGAETTYGLVDDFERVTVGRSVCYRLPSGPDRTVG